MNRKQLIEAFMLEQFLKAEGIAADAVEQGEAPDFCVEAGGRKFGVELTQCFRGDDLNGIMRIKEALAIRVLAKAQQQYAKLGLRPVLVTVSFESVDFRCINREQLVAALVDAVVAFGLGEWRSRKTFPGQRGTKLPAGVYILRATGLPMNVRSRWDFTRTAWVAPLTLAVLQTRINEKARRLEAYRKRVKEVWLIITADGSLPSQMVEIREDFNPSSVSSPFDRTYFFRHPFHQSIRLGGRFALAQQAVQSDGLASGGSAR